MRNTLLLAFIVCIIGLLAFLISTQQEIPENKEDISVTTNDSSMNTPLSLTSSAFSDGEVIPSQYTCDGANSIPPLSISGVPEDAESLVLIMDDPDIPDSVKESRGIEVFDHWVVFNIPTDITTIEEGKQPAGTLGLNSAGNAEYTGPCPPDGEHRYFFKLYALDTTLDLDEGATKQEVEEALYEHILTQTRLLGRYTRI